MDIKISTSNLEYSYISGTYTLNNNVQKITLQDTTHTYLIRSRKDLTSYGFDFDFTNTYTVKIGTSCTDSFKFGYT